MPENIRNWLLLIVVLLALAAAAWYFDEPAPQLCLDGGCHEVF
jgi:hypothetical protein